MIATANPFPDGTRTFATRRDENFNVLTNARLTKHLAQDIGRKIHIGHDDITVANETDVLSDRNSFFYLNRYFNGLQSIRIILRKIQQGPKFTINRVDRVFTI